MLSTLATPDEGQASVLGNDVVDNAMQVRRSIGLAGQNAAVDDDLTGRENLVILGRMLHLGRRGAGRRADELLTRFDLADAADRAGADLVGRECADDLDLDRQFRRLRAR